MAGRLKLTGLCCRPCVVIRHGSIGMVRQFNYREGNSRRRGVAGLQPIACTKPEGSQDSAESLFAKELKKRGINDSTWQPVKKSADFVAEPMTDDQLKKSRALASEGLEGLIPRAKELFKLGASVFLGFGPFILGIGVFFAFLLLFFREDLLHGGRPGLEPPSYVDPYELLDAETSIPMVPFDDSLRVELTRKDATAGDAATE